MPQQQAIIYILCHNDERLERAKIIYRAYEWAVPIKMKYQNATFENAFWPQMWEMRSRWRKSNVVGAFSFRAYQKISLHIVDKAIQERWYDAKGYMHFMDSGIAVLDHLSVRHHRNLFAVYWNDMLDLLGLNDTTSAHCNYFITKPQHMLNFIKWYYWKARPVALKHRMALVDYQYVKGSLTTDQLMTLCGRPHYPFVPFVLERLNKCWFDKYVLRHKPVPGRTRLPYPRNMPAPSPAIKPVAAAVVVSEPASSSSQPTDPENPEDSAISLAGMD